MNECIDWRKFSEECQMDDTIVVAKDKHNKIWLGIDWSALYLADNLKSNKRKSILKFLKIRNNHTVEVQQECMPVLLMQNNPKMEILDLCIDTVPLRRKRRKHTPT